MQALRESKKYIQKVRTSIIVKESMKDIEKKVRTNRINIECKKDIEKKFRTNGMIKEKENI